MLIYPHWSVEKQHCKSKTDIGSASNHYVSPPYPNRFVQKTTTMEINGKAELDTVLFLI